MLARLSALGLTICGELNGSLVGSMPAAWSNSSLTIRLCGQNVRIVNVKLDPVPTGDGTGSPSSGKTCSYITLIVATVAESTLTIGNDPAIDPARTTTLSAATCESMSEPDAIVSVVPAS